MKNRITAIAVLSLLLSMSFEMAEAARRVPRGAFIRRPVSSVNELAAQCVSDPVVRARFARHFGVRPEELAQYIRDNVVIGRVTAGTPRSVYIVTRSGRVVHERRALKRGQPIFVLRDTGEPLLVVACGNPVLKNLPPRVKINVKTLPSYEVIRPNEIPIPPPVAKAPPVPGAPPIAPIIPGPAPAVAAPPVAAVPAVPAGGRSRFPWFLLPLAFLHGGNGENAPPPVPPPEVIPDPGGASLAAAAGLLAAAGYGLTRLRTTRAGRTRGSSSRAA